KLRLGFKMRFHDLRHYNASVMQALGVPDKYAMERLGQATPNMLKTVYQHVMRDKRTEVSDTLNEYMNGLMQHEMQHETVKGQ
ncbi:MAG: site-specific integrase, partial [Clostridia bacterium]